MFGNFAFGQTNNQVKVPGTKCSLIPPTGFELAKAFSGFQDQVSGASILINEIPSPYKSFEEGFTVGALKTKGMNLVSKESIQFNQSKATFYKMTQTLNGTVFIKQMLLFGDAKKSIFVIGIHPQNASSLEPIIKNAILSTQYNPTQKENPLEAAPFSVDVSHTDFKLVKYMSGSLLYSTDGKIPTTKPTLVVGNSLGKVSDQNKRKYAEERIKKLPNGQQSSIYEVNEISIDSLNGYEIIALGKTKDKQSELTYLCMLFNDNGDYYMVLGQTKEDFDLYKKTFNQIAKTFKRKTSIEEK